MHDQKVRWAPAVVMLPGEIDVSNAQWVFDQLSSAFASGATLVIADLTKTVFCDSTGLGTLLRVQRQAARDGAQLRLAIAPGGRFVYSVNETHGTEPGGVSAFSFDKATGKLTFIDKQASGGADPCYISVDAARKWALVANYSGGNLSALPIGADGSLHPLTELIQHTGTGPVKDRQEKAHVHSTILSPDQRYLVVADLGMDQLSVLRFNPAAAETPLTPATDSIVKTTPRPSAAAGSLLASVTCSMVTGSPSSKARI